MRPSSSSPEQKPDSQGGVFSPGRFVRSFGFAFSGLACLWRSQQNFRVHLCAAAIVVVVCALLEVQRQDCALLALAIGLVLIAEAFNTALELLLDAVAPEFHPLVGRSKDVAAAAVLLSALTAVAVAVFVLLPYLLRFLGRLEP